MNAPGRLRRVVLLAAVSNAVAVAAIQQPPSTGTIFGRVDLGSELAGDDFAEAVLLSPEWAVAWNGEVQRRIDDDFSRNIAAVDRDRELFGLIAERAEREATMAVIARMRASLGGNLGDAVRTIDGDGAFEFARVPYGAYRVIVVASIAGAGRIWSGAVTVRSSVPELVEVLETVR